MTVSPVDPSSDRPVATSRRSHWLEGLIVLWVLLIAVAFNLVHLYPEIAVKTPGSNDIVLHVVLTDLAAQTIIQGQDFTDPWLGTMGMGYPPFHYYQHLPHVAVAVVHVLTRGIFPIASMVNWTTYLFLSLFPLSIYWSLRRFGFDQLSCGMGALVASLVATNRLFGFGFGSYVSGGLGLYTQLWAMVLLPPAVAQGYRVLRDGRGYFWATLLLAAVLMSHVLYGYMAFLTLGVLAFIVTMRSPDLRALASAMWRRCRRLMILFLLVVVLTSYFLVPLFMDWRYLNVNVWEQPEKYNSYGYAWVLQSLVRGDLFDFYRYPSLTILVVVGFVICLLRWKEERYLILIAIFLLWLILYFGKSTWGPLVNLLPISSNLHMYRFIAGVHLTGIFLMAIALAAPWRWAVSRSNFWFVAAVLALTLLVLLPVYSERKSALAGNALFISEKQHGLFEEKQELNDLVEYLERLPPGRVYAGQTENWGRQYSVGPTPVYALLQAEGLDMTGRLYHALSFNSDIFRYFDETRRDLYNLYNIRYVVAPEEQMLPDFVKPLQQFGRHRLYQVETTGYFDLVGSGLAFAGGKTDFYPAASSWLASGLPGAKQHPKVFIGSTSQGIERPLPLRAAVDVIPTVKASAGPSRGAVLSEEVGSNSFAAGVRVERESWLLLKATYHPNWRATVDGVETDTVMLMPSFVGVRLLPGNHQVQLEYRSRRLRMVLLGLGLLTLPLIVISEKHGEGLWRRIAPRFVGPISNSAKGSVDE